MIYVTHDQIEAMTLADRIAVMKGGVIQQLDAPQTIYNRPVNRFVAGFLGSPAMNFLDGQAGDATAATGFTAEDVDIPLDRYAFDGRRRRRGRPCFGIRPEHVAFNDAASRLAVSGQRSRSRSSSRWAPTRWSGRSSAARISPSASTSERTPQQSATRCSIGFDPMRASLFDAATGNRL